MRVILSEAKDLANGVWITQIPRRNHRSLCEVPHRLCGSG